MYMFIEIMKKIELLHHHHHHGDVCILPIFDVVVAVSQIVVHLKLYGSSSGSGSSVVVVVVVVVVGSNG